MENAVDALKMAAAVLVFVLALTLFFTTFSKAKMASDSLLTMQDEQAYLESDNVENILYRTNDGVTNDTAYTKEGYRIVSLDAVISTIYRYENEKFAVTIMKQNGEVIARYDTATESLINNWEGIRNSYKENGSVDKTADQQKTEFINSLKSKIKVKINAVDIEPDLDETDFIKLYETQNGLAKGAPITTSERRERIKADINGGEYSCGGQTYEGKDLMTKCKKIDGTNKEIIEITKEIDNSKYFQNTELLDADGYQMPTVEVIYVITD